MNKQNPFGRILIIISILVIISNLAVAQSVSSLGSYGTILLNGKPFFPFGLYFSSSRLPAPDRMDGIKTMISSGFNVAFISNEGEGFQNLLDTAEKYNFYYVVGTNRSSDKVQAINTIKHRGCIFAWDLTDDSDDPGLAKPDDLVKLNSSIKSADPDHLTFMTLTGYFQQRRNLADLYTGMADLPAYQAYPIGPLPASDLFNRQDIVLTDTYNRLLMYVQSAAKYNKPFILTNQVFSWNFRINNPSPRWPVVSELRNMVYTSLAAGVKGILAYSYTNELLKQMTLWEEFKTIRQDILTLEPVLLFGSLTRVNTEDEEVIASYWEYNDECYVVVVNTSYTKSKSAFILLPEIYENAPATATSLFPRMPNTLSFTGRNLTGDIPPVAVEFYKLVLLNKPPAPVMSKKVKSK